MSDSVRPHRRQPTRLRRPWDSPGKNTGVGCHFLLQQPTAGQNQLTQSLLYNKILNISHFYWLLYWKKNTKYNITYMWESKILHKWTCLQNRNRLTDTFRQTWHKPGWRKFIAKKSIWFWLGMGLPNFCKPCTNFWLPRWLSGKEPACQRRRHERCSFHPWVGKIPSKRAWHLTPVFLSGESHGQRNLAGYRITQSRTWLKQLSMHTWKDRFFFSLLFICAWSKFNQMIRWMSLYLPKTVSTI